MSPPLLVVLLVALAVSTRGVSFDWQTGRVSLAHCVNAYCHPERYLWRNRSLPEELQGFQTLLALSDKTYDVEGYLGVDPVKNALYIVFRGSSSLPNYWADAITALVPFSPCRHALCQVHEGFLLAEQGVVSNNVLKILRNLRTQFPSHDVIFTGHSLGGALATLMAIRVIHEGIFPADVVQLFTFGSPRIGNAEFALFASKLISKSVRVTHHQDVIPHLPPISFGFLHMAEEWYQSGDTTDIQQCVSYEWNDGNGNFTMKEDSNCSSQWYFYETSVADHLVYLTVPIGDDACITYSNHGESNSTSRRGAQNLITSLSRRNRADHKADKTHRTDHTPSLVLYTFIAIFGSLFFLYLCFSWGTGISSIICYLSTNRAKRIQYTEISDLEDGS